MYGRTSIQNTIRGNAFAANHLLNIDLSPSVGIDEEEIIEDVSMEPFREIMSTQIGSYGVDINGANNGRMAPALFATLPDGYVSGTADAPNGSIVELYSADGTTLVGGATVINKQFYFAYRGDVKQPIMATVTDLDGNTSEFSLPGELNLGSPYVLPGGRVYAFAVITDTLTNLPNTKATEVTVTVAGQDFTLYNDGQKGDLAKGDKYYSGWFTAPTDLGDYPVTLAASRTGVAAVWLHVINKPTLAILTDLVALKNEFALTDNETRPRLLPRTVCCAETSSPIR